MWNLATNLEKTTWLWAFSYYPAVTFERETMIAQIERLAQDCVVGRKPSEITIKNDVACLIRTYVARQSSTHAGHDGVLESPLTELGLIKAIDKKDKFRFVRGLKPTLGNGVFAYAVAKFWDSYSKADTLSFEAIAHEACGPGRVFGLGENDLVDRLISLEKVTKGAFKWSETAGLKQLVRTGEIIDDKALEYIRSDYSKTIKNQAA